MINAQVATVLSSTFYGYDPDPRIVWLKHIALTQAVMWSRVILPMKRCLMATYAKVTISSTFPSWCVARKIWTPPATPPRRRHRREQVTIDSTASNLYNSIIRSYGGICHRGPAATSSPARNQKPVVGFMPMAGRRVRCPSPQVDDGRMATVQRSDATGDLAA